MDYGDIVDVHILASGSKGNATLIKNENQYLLIDAGISYLKLKEKIEQLDIELISVTNLLITHEHQDHIKGVKTLLKQGFIKDVFLTKGTYDAIKELIAHHKVQVHLIQTDEYFKVASYNVQSFMLSHDAKEPVGFVIKCDEKKVVLLTDTGYVDQSYFPLFMNADLYILEANHNPEKLMKSARPFLLKKRILGEKGHLSNQDAAWLINHFVQQRKSVWVAAHISEDCNATIDIEMEVVKVLDDPTKIELIISSQETVSVMDL